MQEGGVPSIRSTNSSVSLKGEDSKPRLPPGLLVNMNPKSMCTRLPSALSRILPLCLHREGRSCGRFVSQCTKRTRECEIMDVLSAVVNC
jgi:hypothetical protein